MPAVHQNAQNGKCPLVNAAGGRGIAIELAAIAAVTGKITDPRCQASDRFELLQPRHGGLGLTLLSPKHGSWLNMAESETAR